MMLKFDLNGKASRGPGASPDPPPGDFFHDIPRPSASIQPEPFYRRLKPPGGPDPEIYSQKPGGGPGDAGGPANSRWRPRRKPLKRPAYLPLLTSSSWRVPPIS